MFKVIDFKFIEDVELYKTIISQNNLKSAYNRIEYFEVFCGGLDNLVCFLLQEKEETILMSGYLKQIKIYDSQKEYYDFNTPYGYSGPCFSENISDSTIKLFWLEVEKWQEKNNIVSEFVRFNLFDNSRCYNGLLHKTMLNIKGEIISEELQWKNFDAKVRKNVKRAQRENLSSKFFYKEFSLECIKEFYDIYIATMKRTNAISFFFYSFDSFSNFILNNNELCAICTVYDNDMAVSTELVLLSNNSIFSFLGGTLPEAFDKRPNDFLKFEVINWARENGLDYYVLGGGYGYEDGIFKYKKAFFPNDTVEYSTGRKIINSELYSQFVSEVNIRKNSDEILELSDTSFFPLYNKQ